jgi:hypothetical protein
MIQDRAILILSVQNNEVAGGTQIRASTCDRLCLTGTSIPQSAARLNTGGGQ